MIAVLVGCWPPTVQPPPVEEPGVVEGSEEVQPDPPEEPAEAAESEEDEDSVVEALLDPRLADGFDLPIGDPDGKGTYVSAVDGRVHDGWRVAVDTAEAYSVGLHTGEDWNGVGGGDSELGQPVMSTARGEVIVARDFGGPWGNVVMVEHRYVENHEIETVRSLYAHLESIAVEEGAWVKRRQQLGTIGNAGGQFSAHLHFEIRSDTTIHPTYWPSSYGKDAEWILAHYHDPSDFIAARRSLEVPAELDHVLIADKSAHRLTLARSGEVHRTVEMALSQVPEGDKHEQGDLRVPEGRYAIIQKSRGPFTGKMAPFFGVAWMRVSYPNDFDAADGLERGVIEPSQARAIRKANAEGEEPPKNTALGGGIGIHGWAGDWPEDSRALTWGCISVQNHDLDVLYDEVPLGTRIYIVP